MKKCPFCAENIKDDAIFCRYCKRDLVEQNIRSSEKNNSLAESDQKEAANQQAIKSSYSKYFLNGALFGILVSFVAANSIADKIGHGISNIYIYGAMGYGICAYKNKEYVKIWFVPLIFICGFLLQLVVFLSLM